VRTLSLHPLRLLQDSLRLAAPIYGSLLIFYLPIAAASFLQLAMREPLFRVFSVLFYWLIGSIFSASQIIYIYQRLNGHEITIHQALQTAIKKFSPLLLWRVLQTVLVLSPCFPRLTFVTWTIMLEDSSTEEGIKRSWKLTRGHGWQIFGNLIALSLCFGVLKLLSNSIVGSIFGVSVWEVSQRSSMSYLPGLVAQGFWIGLSFLLSPISGMFYMLIFMYLMSLEEKSINQDTGSTFRSQHF
jgi:hypothetical protein